GAVVEVGYAPLEAELRHPVVDQQEVPQLQRERGLSRPPGGGGRRRGAGRGGGGCEIAHAAQLLRLRRGILHAGWARSRPLPVTPLPPRRRRFRCACAGADARPTDAGASGAGPQRAPSMSEGSMSKAATMEIPIHGNGDSRRMADDDGLEQDLQQVMVSGPNLNETSIVSGGYGGTAEGIVPTGIIKGSLVPSHPPRGPLISPSPSAASRIASQAPMATAPPQPSHDGEEAAAAAAAATRGVAVEKFDIVRKWGINTYKCTKQLLSERFGRGSRTVDLELETQIELLRDTKRKYEALLGLARALTSHFYSLVQTQHALADAFSDLSQKSPELQ
ncbi:hypothetical protein E2320_005732, partial [Naja naja]